VDRKGFTLVETVVAMAVLTVIVAGTFSAVSFACSASVAAEELNTARNIASYALEFIRSRNVTRQGTHGSVAGWYAGPGSGSEGLPGIIDLTGEPLAINSSPLCPGDPGMTIANTCSTLQGYVSLCDPGKIPGGEDDPVEPNAHVGSEGSMHRYQDAVTGDPYILRFPLDSTIATPNPIQDFTAWGDYVKEWEGSRLPTVWGSYPLADGRLDKHCTTSPARREACRSYRGYRVLTQIAARSDDDAYRHVRTYDVRVTVLWMSGTVERHYALETSIATY